jgi:broad specificity phosphatase PhoE
MSDQRPQNPTTKTIYLIRHGETDFNRQGVVQGSGVDSDLNELGQAQAEAFFQHYQHIPFDKVYTSGLKRTHQSVNKFLQKNLLWEQHTGLNEISWGVREGKIPNNRDNEYYKILIDSWIAGETNMPSEGEPSVFSLPYFWKGHLTKWTLSTMQICVCINLSTIMKHKNSPLN